MKKYSRLITKKYNDYKSIHLFMEKSTFIFSNDLNQIMYKPETCPEGKLVACSSWTPKTAADPEHLFLPDFEFNKYKVDERHRLEYLPKCFRYCRRVIEK